jgi:hypothetical protein
MRAFRLTLLARDFRTPLTRFQVHFLAAEFDALFHQHLLLGSKAVAVGVAGERAG